MRISQAILFFPASLTTICICDLDRLFSIRVAALHRFSPTRATLMGTRELSMAIVLEDRAQKDVMCGKGEGGKGAGRQQAGAPIP